MKRAHEKQRVGGETLNKGHRGNSLLKNFETAIISKTKKGEGGRRDRGSKREGEVGPNRSRKECSLQTCFGADPRKVEDWKKTYTLWT